MKKYLLYLLPIIVSCSIQKKSKQVISNHEKTDDYQLETLLVELLGDLPNGTQLSFGFVEGADINYLGLVKQNNKIDTIDNKDNIFEIGSISKVFTSLLFTQFIRVKKVGLHDPVQNYFSFTLNKGDKGYDPNEVRLIHLSNHTSGLPRVPIDLFFDTNTDRKNPYANYTPEKLEKHLQTNFYRQSKAGEKHAYSNLGAGLLGYILEKKSNRAYEELLNEMIFTKLSMNSSSVYIKDTNRLIKGRNKKGVVKNWDFSSLAGAGAIKSTVNDMVKFINHNINTTDQDYLLMRDSTFSINEKMNMGLGWHIIKREGKELLFHNGGTGGYSSSMVIDIKNKKGIIILCNIAANITAGKLDKISMKWINTP